MRFRYAGIYGGNGQGDLISATKADGIKTAFTAPYTVERIKLAGLYDDGGFCRECLKFHCNEHWHLSTTGGGECPERHFKLLAPTGRPMSDDAGQLARAQRLAQRLQSAGVRFSQTALPG